MKTDSQGRSHIPNRTSHSRRNPIGPYQTSFWFAVAGLLLQGTVVDPCGAQQNDQLTALDRYVQKPDDTYAWTTERTLDHNGAKIFILDLKSQTWRTSKDVNRTVWQHWLRVVVPAEVKSDVALLMIGGGGNGGNAPNRVDSRLFQVATATKTIVAEIGMIPNQPLIFHNDGKKRVEDDLIAYTWDQFIRTGDETWPARLPMVKSVVRGMDAVQELIGKQYPDSPVKDFVVAGGSKRGWTTWMTAAVDNRVVGIMPIVIDVLNTKESMNHHYAAYGFWAPAVGDYVHHKITHRRNWPEYEKLLRIEDPYFYRDRFDMPKCIINSAGDQFFLPDSSQFYFDDLVGEKHLCYVPNSDHSLDGTNALDTLLAFHFCVAHKIPRPTMTWEFSTENSITLKTNDQPKSVVLWRATNTDARDFRMEKIGKAYRPTDLSGNGQYTAMVPKPEKGWTAYFIQAEFDVGAPTPLRLTTPVRIHPNVLPFAEKVAPEIKRPNK